MDLNEGVHSLKASMPLSDNAQTLIITTLETTGTLVISLIRMIFAFTQHGLINGLI